MLIGTCGNTAGMEAKKLIFVYVVNRPKKRFKDSQTVTGKLVGFFHWHG